MINLIKYSVSSIRFIPVSWFFFLYLLAFSEITLISNASGYLSVISYAGTGNVGTTDTNNISPLVANINQPVALVLKTGSSYFSDTNNHVVRRIAGNGLMTVYIGVVNVTGYGGDNIPKSSARLAFPKGITTDTNDFVFFCDEGNHLVRYFDNNANKIKNYAGTPQIAGNSGDSLPATSAQLNGPTSIWFNFMSIAYIADKANHKIRKVLNTGTHVISTFAGTGTAGVSGDGAAATDAQLNNPYAVWGDSSGNLFILELGNHKVRKVVISSGIISTCVGTGASGYNGDHISATLAQLASPKGLTGDSSGSIYIADTDNQRIRKVSPLNSTFNEITTVVGNGGIDVNVNFFLLASSTSLNYPKGVFFDVSSADLYIMNSLSHQVVISRIIGYPTSQPSVQPSCLPSMHPTSQPSSLPSQPSSLPSLIPSPSPSTLPTLQPSSEPTCQPSSQPFSLPSSTPSNQPSRFPSSQPSSLPSRIPSSLPSSLPTLVSSSHPTSHPSQKPTTQPTTQPSSKPSRHPSSSPSSQPSHRPSVQPTSKPSSQPFSVPTQQPSAHPSAQPSSQPMVSPSAQPSSQPSTQPLTTPSVQPSACPSVQPSVKPSDVPTAQPSRIPSLKPSCQPSSFPTRQPSVHPSSFPSSQPFDNPSSQPTVLPSSSPDKQPSSQPTSQPSSTPSIQPSAQPSLLPSSVPLSPSNHPSFTPSTQPSRQPSSFPSFYPSNQPTSHPSVQPFSVPSLSPSGRPTLIPSSLPSSLPVCLSSALPSSYPSAEPSTLPSSFPKAHPTLFPSTQPSVAPTVLPSCQPSECPSSQPSSPPSCVPSGQPSVKPSTDPSHCPSLQPFATPTGIPSRQPSSFPSLLPTGLPSLFPSSSPSKQPISVPSNAPWSFPSSLPSAQPTAMPTLLPTTDGFLRAVRLNFTMNIIPSDSNFKQSLFMFGIIHPEESVTDDLNFTAHQNVGNNYVVFGSRIKTSVVDFSSSYSSSSFTVVDAQFGIENSVRSVAVAGDINDDSHNDILIGDPLASKAYLVFGTKHGFTEMNTGLILCGEDQHDYFGWSVSSAGDFNADGVGDFLICAMVRNRCYLFYGQSNLYKNIYVSSPSTAYSSSNNAFVLNITEKVGFVIHGRSNTQNTGMSIANAGDFNKDGYDDVIISASLSSSNIVYLLFGHKRQTSAFYLDQLSSTTGLKIAGTLGSFAGISVSGIGDMNGDGYDDVVIGCLPYTQGYSTQFSYVIYGFPSNGSSSNYSISLSSLSLPHQGMKIIGGGIVVSGPGDVNSDGYNDIMVTNYRSWINQKGVFLIKYPEKWTLSPTVAPSVGPTFSPTSSFSPTRKPTISPSFFVSKSPTITPSTTKPSPIPSDAPNGPTFFPTVTPTTPTNFPSSHPSLFVPVPTFFMTAIPSFSPTEIPSEPPSFTPSRIPSESPSILPTLLPSRSPSQSPTLIPTKKPTILPSPQPSSSPSTYFINGVVDDDGFSTVHITNSDPTLPLPSDKQRQQYFIDVVNDITVEGKGKIDKFIILPSSNVTISLLNFKTDHDIVDLSAFPGLRSLYGLSYSESPLVISLPNDQQLLFLSVQAMAQLSEENFLFSSRSSSATSSSSSSSDSSLKTSRSVNRQLIWVISCTSSLFLVTAFLCQSGSWFSVFKGTKDVRKREFAKLFPAKREVVNRISNPNEDDIENSSDSVLTGFNRQRPFTQPLETLEEFSEEPQYPYVPEFQDQISESPNSSSSSLNFSFLGTSSSPHSLSRLHSSAASIRYSILLRRATQIFLDQDEENSQLGYNSTPDERSFNTFGSDLYRLSTNDSCSVVSGQDMNRNDDSGSGSDCRSDGTNIEYHQGYVEEPLQS
jgi:hypothetical protein